MGKLYIVFVLVFLTAGCTSIVSSEDILIKQDQKTFLNIDKVQSQPWFNASRHRLQNISLKQDDNVITRGIHFSTTDSKYLVLYFGGNGFRTADAGGGLSRVFASIGTDFIWIDYRGIGASEGSPTISKLRNDAQKVLEYAQSYANANDKKLVLHGVSIGSFLAMELASKNELDVAVIEAPISNASEILENMVPWWSKWFLTLKPSPEVATLSNTELIRKFENNLMIIVGENDKLTPVDMSEQLYKLTPSANKRLVIVKGAQHVDSMSFEQTADAYKEFLKSISKP